MLSLRVLQVSIRGSSIGLTFSVLCIHFATLSSIVLIILEIVPLLLRVVGDEEKLLLAKTYKCDGSGNLLLLKKLCNT